jgi:hypothetical protein
MKVNNDVLLKEFNEKFPNVEQQILSQNSANKKYNE